MTPFDEGEKAQIEKILKEELPDEQRKCTAFRFFENQENVKQLFEGFNKINQLDIHKLNQFVGELAEYKNTRIQVIKLISELQEHKINHTTIDADVKALKKWKHIHKALSFLGAGIGAFVAMVIEKKIK